MWSLRFMQNRARNFYLRPFSFFYPFLPFSSKAFFLLTSLTPSGLAIGAAVLGCATFAVAADVAPPLLLPAGGGGSAGGGVPVLPGPQDSIIVGEPHVSGLRNIEDDSIKRMWTLVTARSVKINRVPETLLSMWQVKEWKCGKYCVFNSFHSSYIVSNTRYLMKMCGTDSIEFLSLCNWLNW